MVHGRYTYMLRFCGKKERIGPKFIDAEERKGTDRRNAGLYNTRENIFYIQVRGCARIFFV